MEVQKTEKITEPKKSKRKTIISIITVLLLSFSVYIGYAKYEEKQREQQRREQQEKLKEYEQLFKSTAEAMIATSITAEEMLNKYHDVWSDAIFNDYAEVDGEIIYGDFNEAVSAQRQSFEEKGTIELLEKSQKIIATSMKKLNNPPDEYKEEYDVLMDMYKVFNEYIDLAKTPEGSLQSFSEQTRELSNDLTSLYKELEVQMP
jgi:hypothetical protein